MESERIWSIVICTHNRCNDLQETLQGLTHLDYPEDDLEILVVDNASRDDTRRIFDEAANRFKNIRFLREEKLGLSYARNKGIENSRGKFIAFLDDDAIPDPDWLKKLELCFRDQKVACAGGMVKPVWQKHSNWPDWLHHRLIGYFTVIDYTDFRRLGYPFCPAGTNVAFRRKIFEIVGYFNPQLGRTGNLLLSGEEADLCVAIEQADYRIVYTPEAVVHHKIHEDRLTTEWVKQRSYWGGVSSAIIERRWFGILNRLGKTGKYLFLIIVSEIMKRIPWKARKEKFFWECQRLFSGAFLKSLWTGRPGISKPVSEP